MTLLNLPTELISRIISFLDTPSPLEITIRQKPKAPQSLKQLPSASHNANNASSVSSSASRPSLKHLSLTSRFFRTLTIPFIFKHSIVHPLQVTNFLTFLQNHDLSSRILTMTAPLESHFTHFHPAWWSRLLDALSCLTTFTIIAPPEVLDALAGIHTWTTDAWAFNMPYQIIRLEHSPSGSSPEAQSPMNLVDNDDDTLPTLLTARKWHTLTLNEGSSLQAYTTYEFFLRRTPSLLTALHFNNSTIADSLFRSLRSFSFIAIFPFYNHVDEILKSIRKMTSLESLSIKLCPDPDSTVFRDEIELNNGHMDVNDPWNECETSWMLIAHTVIFLTVQGHLETFHMADVQIEAVRESLEKAIVSRLQEWWSYEGDGSGKWYKRPQSIDPTKVAALGTADGAPAAPSI
ncbi:hypothetical protein LTR10_022946 [Elasticomyces elasticus]|uniref:F-box domain-containing protein n=1 Tax=Exophiala sideris TaxID=1016849 RepID=A0ABR0J030_9EURO|nr:hypothetical protein LTR10_022946 [Elasticomyces elasticus]KAK5022681.1 hypothetical protein LTS07_009904 [Exophiala sideris]KAK5052257.1 hypothetical protein LTR69_010019 [Exophiala sideris]